MVFQISFGTALYYLRNISNVISIKITKLLRFHRFIVDTRNTQVACELISTTTRTFVVFVAFYFSCQCFLGGLQVKLNDVEPELYYNRHSCLHSCVFSFLTAMTSNELLWSDRQFRGF